MLPSSDKPYRDANSINPAVATLHMLTMPKVGLPIPGLVTM